MEHAPISRKPIKSDIAADETRGYLATPRGVNCRRRRGVKGRVGGLKKVYGTAGREEMRDTTGSSAVLLISTGRDRRTHILSVLRREDAAAFGDAFTSAAIAKYLDDVCS